MKCEIKEGTYLVIGSSGFIGRNIVNTIRKSSFYLEGKIKLICVVRKIDEKAAALMSDKNITLYGYQDMLQIRESIDYIIHTASLTSKFTIENESINMLNNDLKMMFNVGKLIEKNKIRGMVYLSSNSVHQSYNFISEELFDDIRKINLYAEDKRMCEIICGLLSMKSNVNVVRLFTVYGPNDNLERGTFLTEFMKSALLNRNIEIQSNGNLIRNLCYIDDVVSAIFYVLFYSKKSTCYDVGGENATMLQVANQIAKINGKICVDVLDHDISYNPTDNQIPNLYKIHQVGWKHTTNIEDGLTNMYNSYL